MIFVIFVFQDCGTIRKMKASRSGSEDASINVPREVFGATGFAIMATAKCPMNILSCAAAILPPFTAYMPPASQYVDVKE